MARAAESACLFWWLVWLRREETQSLETRDVLKLPCSFVGLPAWPPVSESWPLTEATEAIPESPCFGRQLCSSFHVYSAHLALWLNPEFLCLKSWPQEASAITSSITIVTYSAYLSGWSNSCPEEISFSPSYCSGLVKGKFPLYSPPSRYPELGPCPTIISLPFLRLSSWDSRLPRPPPWTYLLFKPQLSHPSAGVGFRTGPKHLQWSFWLLESCSGGSFSPSTAQGSVWQGQAVPTC